MGLVGFKAKAGPTLLFINLIIAFAPDDLTVAFKSQNMRGQAVKEEAVMADNHSAPSEAFKSFFKS